MSLILSQDGYSQLRVNVRKAVSCALRSPFLLKVDKRAGKEELSAAQRGAG